MSIEAINDEFGYEIGAFREKLEAQMASANIFYWKAERYVIHV